MRDPIVTANEIVNLIKRKIVCILNKSLNENSYLRSKAIDRKIANA